MEHSANPAQAQFPLPRLLRKYIEMESTAGVVMLIAAALAMLAANSAFYPIYKAFINTPIAFGLGDAQIVEPFKLWVKDILMVFFFLAVGLELKREFAEGFLAQRDQVALPFIAAAAGMAVPAVLFLVITAAHPELQHGWAIPSATDIAFALCVLMLCARNAPPAVKIFLLAIAIFDDLGAILIIAFFYSSGFALEPLLLTGLGIGALYALSRLNVTLITPYILVGVYLWFCLFHAGIHTTVAGVLVGVFMPVRCKLHPSNSPVNRTLHFLHPWVNFLVLPVFAFTAAGVHFDDMQWSDALQPLPLGITLALFLGKQIGIFGSSLLTIKSGLAGMPQGANFGHIYAVSVIAGVGFTMSLFIGALAFNDDGLQNAITLGVIAGSLLSALWGAVVLRLIR